MTKQRTAVVVGASLLLVATGSAAAEPTKHDCIASNEDGQDLRRAGRLRAATERFEACAVSACPGPLREDCAARLEQVRRAMPSIIFSANDPAGHPIMNVRVTMDGAPLTERLDGAPMIVEPGEHTFELVARGFSPFSKRLVIREGAKERREAAVLEPVRSSSPSESERVGPRATSGESGTNASDGSLQRMLGIAVGGLGVASVAVGVGFGLAANANHDEATKACPQPALCSSREIVDQGNSARDQAVIANVAFVASGVLVASGVVFYLSAPRGNTVTVAASGAGARIGVSW